MSNYADFDLPYLLDLLVKHTKEYTKMLSYSNYTVEEFSQCKQTLAEIQAAIHLKRDKLDYMIPSSLEERNDSIETAG